MDIESLISETRQRSAAEEKKNTSEYVSNAFKLRRQAIVFGIARKLFSVFDSCENVGGPFVQDEQTNWIRIESLSQLRTEVGGRFQNLKEKWTNAGFPLRDHRGDRKAQAELNQDGWIELASWIGKQGFESRLAPEESAWLFEVRKMEK